jgi:hypothetical protein
MSENRDIEKIAVRLTYYLTTLFCLGLSAWALRYAYLYFNIPLILWIFLYILITAYLVGMSIIAYQKRGFARAVIHSLAFQLVPLCGAILVFSLVSRGDTYKPTPGKPNTYERAFNDMQNKQKAAAVANGLAPFKSRAEIEEKYNKLRLTRKLVHIETNPKYIVRELTSSSPYVVPKVRDLLDDIAERFQEKTQSKTRFIVTSVLRTEEDVKKLRKTNVNASTASCHCNATTIDISYVRFGEDRVRPRDEYQLRLALAQTLHELRKEGRCYVKIERKQYCYHITVR